MVATPIGNLGDFSFRAIKTLNESDLILCEDTRKAKVFLKEFDIKTKCKSLHEFTNPKVIEKYISYLKTGKCIALISDAGTPLISDPGYEIVKRSKEEQIMVNPIPGPSSVISALIASGLKIDKFIFEKRTLVLFESPRRIKKLVQTSLKIFGGKRRVCLAKDISKLHQKFFTGTIVNDLAFSQMPPIAVIASYSGRSLSVPQKFVQFFPQSVIEDV